MTDKNAQEGTCAIHGNLHVPAAGLAERGQMVELVVSTPDDGSGRFSERSKDAGSEQVSGTARGSSANTAKLRDDFRNHMLISGRHYMGAGNSGDLCKFLQQIDADALSFFFRIVGALESRDQRVRNERAGKVIANPDG